jgi:Zn ribbon nucleic-acid-binding protein
MDAGDGTRLMPPPVRYQRCPACGSAMKAATTFDAELEEQMPVWRCIRCGAEVPS